MSLRRTWLALIGLLCAPALLWGALRHVRGEEAWDDVRAAARAHERVSYRGTASWRRTKWGKSVAIEHDAERGLTRYEWNRKGKWGRPYVVDGVSTRSCDPAGWCLDLDALEDAYAVHPRRAATYLRRPARVLELRPRFEGRPTVRLTLDEATRLPLKVESFRPDGSLYRVIAFREIEIGPCRVERERESPYRKWAGTSVAPERLSEAVGFDVMLPAYLPGGFRLVDARLQDWIGPQARLLYTDGITAFELRQSRIYTPARMEVVLAERMGKRRADFFVRGYLARRMTQTATAGEAGEGAVVRRVRRPMHLSYALRVGGIEVSLSSRSDLDGQEPVQVLRSLRAR